MTIECNLWYVDSKLVFVRENGEKVCQATPYFSTNRGIFEGLSNFESFDLSIKGPLSIILPPENHIVASIFTKFVQEHIADVTTCFAMFRRKNTPELDQETPNNLPQTTSCSQKTSTFNSPTKPADSDDEGLGDVHTFFDRISKE